MKMCGFKKYSIVITLTEGYEKIEQCLAMLSEQLFNVKENVQVIIIQGKELCNCKEKCERLLHELKIEGIYLESSCKKVQEAKIDTIPYIEGNYVTFIYDTTIMEKDTLQEVDTFLKESGYNENIVTVSLKKDKKVKKYFFEKYNCEENITWIDIEKQPLIVLRSMLGVFVKKEKLDQYKDGYGDMFGETLLITKILSEEKKYPIIQTTKIEYIHDRIEFVNIQEDAEIIDLYENIYERYYMPLIKLAEEKKELEAYIKNLLLCDISLKVMKKKAPNFVENEKIWNEFKKDLEKVLVVIDNKNIKMQPASLLSGYCKYYLIDKIKNNREHQWGSVYQKSDVIVFDEDKDVVTYGKYAKIYLKDIKISKGCLFIKGSVGSVMLSDQYQLFLCYGEKRIEVENIELKEDDIFSLGKIIHDIYSFLVKIPFDSDFVFLENGKISIWFEIVQNTSKIVPEFNISKLNSKVKVKYQHSLFVILDKYILRRNQKQLEIMELNDKNLRKLENELIDKWKIWIEQKKINAFGNLNLINENRLFYYNNRNRFKKKNICLIGMEKEFPKELIKERKKKGETPIIIVKSPNFKREMGMGKVVLFGSKEHCQYTLVAKKIIAYKCNKEILNPFGKDRIFYNGIITTDIETR